MAPQTAEVVAQLIHTLGHDPKDVVSITLEPRIATVVYTDRPASVIREGDRKGQWNLKTQQVPFGKVV